MGYERGDGRHEGHRDRYQDDRGYRQDTTHGYRDRGDPRVREARRDERFGDDRRPRGYDYDDRGFFDRAGDEVRSWFGDEEAERRRRWDERVQQREYERRYGTPGRSGSADYYGSGYGAVDPLMAGAAPWDAGFGATYGVRRGAGATSSYGLGAGPEHDGWGRDPNYRAWRQRQIDDLDRDYADYRREHQSRFNDDFGSWRTNRQGQRSSLRDVQEHQEVVGSDGQHIGTVDHIRGDHILLTRTDKDAGGHHHSIPSSWIVQVGDKIEVNRTAAQAKAAWKDTEHSDGPHNLNRAFSGTY
jgi:hypothetical protein